MTRFQNLLANQIEHRSWHAQIVPVGQALNPAGMTGQTVLIVSVFRGSPGTEITRPVSMSDKLHLRIQIVLVCPAASLAGITRRIVLNASVLAEWPGVETIQGVSRVQTMKIDL
jgi:hypothetical protein